jgi:hypothetical protein
MIRTTQLKNIFLIIIIILCNCNSFTQELKVQAGMFGFFDNREYFNYYENDQTIFGTRAYAKAGIALNQKNEFYWGADGLYEFGSSFDPYLIKPILYFHYHDKSLNMLVGSFQRHKLINLPNILLNDTLKYYRPNIEGMYFGYSRDHFTQDIWIDWTSRQTNEDREIFIIGGTGALKIRNLFYRHDFIFTHYALTARAAANEHIHDNGGFYSKAGIDLSHRSVFDSLTLSSGFTFSYDRLRNEYPLRYYNGSISELYIQYNTIGAKYTIYIGSGQILMTGDPLYEARNYSRLDIFWIFFNKPGIEGEIELSVHFVNDFVDYSQKFTIRAAISQSRKLY